MYNIYIIYNNVRRVYAYARKPFVLVMLLLLMSSCASHKAVTNMAVRDSVVIRYKDSVVLKSITQYRDSIVMHDSIVLVKDSTGRVVSKEVFHLYDRLKAEKVEQSDNRTKCLEVSESNSTEKVTVKEEKPKKEFSYVAFCVVAVIIALLPVLARYASKKIL